MMLAEHNLTQDGGCSDVCVGKQIPHVSAKARTSRECFTTLDGDPCFDISVPHAFAMLHQS